MEVPHCQFNLAAMHAELAKLNVAERFDPAIPQAASCLLAAYQIRLSYRPAPGQLGKRAKIQVYREHQLIIAGGACQLRGLYQICVRFSRPALPEPNNPEVEQN